MLLTLCTDNDVSSTFQEARREKPCVETGTGRLGRHRPSHAVVSLQQRRPRQVSPVPSDQYRLGS